MKKIIVATDFSAAADNALNYAADMAIELNADLLLFHVYQLPLSYSEMPVTMSLDNLLLSAEKELEKLKEQMILKKGKRLNIDMEVRVGSFYIELKSYCELINPYVVIMGSQGTTAASRFFFGGHAVHAMQHLNYPVITVPPAASFSSIKYIALACDLNSVLETVPVEEIRFLVKDFHASLHVLNTGRQETFKEEIVFQSSMLEKLLGGIIPHYHFITNDNIDDGILDYIEHNPVDLLIVLPKRHSLIEKLIHKSHSKKFILHSHVPVMALHQ